MFGIGEMDIFGNKKSNYIGSHDIENDIKALTEVICLKCRDHFTDIHMGKSSIIFFNSFFVNLFSRYEKFGEISFGEIRFEPKANYFIVQSNISFRRWLTIYSIMLLISFICFISSEAGSILAGLLICAIFMAVLSFYPQFTAARFNSMLKSCIKECGFTISGLPNQRVCTDARKIAARR